MVPLGATDPQRSHPERRWGLCDFRERRELLLPQRTPRTRRTAFTAENAENAEIFLGTARAVTPSFAKVC